MQINDGSKPRQDETEVESTNVTESLGKFEDFNIKQLTCLLDSVTMNISLLEKEKSMENLEIDKIKSELETLYAFKLMLYNAIKSKKE